MIRCQDNEAKLTGVPIPPRASVARLECSKSEVCLKTSVWKNWNCPKSSQRWLNITEGNTVQRIIPPSHCGSQCDCGVSVLLPSNKWRIVFVVSFLFFLHVSSERWEISSTLFSFAVGWSTNIYFYLLSCHNNIYTANLILFSELHKNIY